MWKSCVLSGQIRVHRTDCAEENDGENFTKGFQPQDEFVPVDAGSG